MKKVAITGGLASGKSTVCRLFRELGAEVLSSDQIVHKLLSLETPLGKRILTLLGTDVVVEGQFDRPAIAKKVFANPSLLAALEALLHPAVQEEIERATQKLMNEQDKNKPPLLVVEVPLLFEIQGESFYDVTISVCADQSLCRQRFIHATGNDAAEFQTRSALQMPMEEKCRKADFTLLNNGSKPELKQKVKEIFHLIT